MLRKLMGKDKRRDSETPFRFIRLPGGNQSVAVRRSFSSLNLEDSWRQRFPFSWFFATVEYGLGGEPWYSYLPFCGSEEDSDASTLLSKHQKMIITTTWPFLAEEIPSVGLSLQACLFEKDPSLKSLFEFRGKTGQDLVEDRRYRQHAFWLVQAVSSVVENLDNLDDTVSTMFNELGEKHAAIPYFSTTYFGLLPEVWGRVWEERLTGRYTPNTEKAWGKLFRYVVACLAEGFQLVGLEPSFLERESSTSGQDSQDSLESQEMPAGLVDNDQEGAGRKRHKLKQMLGSSHSKEPLVGVLVTTPSDEDSGKGRVTTASLSTPPLTRQNSLTSPQTSSLSPQRNATGAKTVMPPLHPVAALESSVINFNLDRLKRKPPENEKSPSRSDVDESTSFWLSPGFPRRKGKKPEKEFHFLQHDSAQERQLLGDQSSEDRKRGRKISYFTKLFHGGAKPSDAVDDHEHNLTGNDRKVSTIME